MISYSSTGFWQPAGSAVAELVGVNSTVIVDDIVGVNIITGVVVNILATGV